MKNTTAIIIVIGVVLVGGYFLLKSKPTVQNNKEENTEIDQNIPIENTTTTATNTNSDISTSIGVGPTHTVSVDVVGGSFYFTPKTITVKKGDTVTINFKNDGGMHDFRIDEFNVATAKIGSGQSQTVTFVADKTGSFEYYCSVGNHRQMGMKGTLVVE